MCYSIYSIYIPHIFMNIPIQKIVDTFEYFNIGKIERIDSAIRWSKNGYKYRIVFIHFEFWNINNKVAMNLKEKIENPNKIARIIYDDPWYWIILPNTSYKHPTTIYKNLDYEENIKKLKDEIDCIYEEIYKREYIPIQTPEWSNDSITFENNLGEIDYTKINKNYVYTDLQPDFTSSSPNQYDDISIQSNSTVSQDEHVEKISTSTNNYNIREWMTRNICDNA